MLDIRFIRENTEAVDAAMQSRRYAWDRQAFLGLDSLRRQTIGEMEGLQAERNAASKRIGELMREAKGDAGAAQAVEAEAMKQQVREVNDQISQLEQQLAAAEIDLDALAMTLPNLPHFSVPDGADEGENVEVRRHGTPPRFDFDPKPHWDIGTDLKIIDFERAVKLARSRFVLLSGLGARMERALISLMLDTHIARGYHEWWPPVLGNVETLTGTGQLPKFADDQFMTTDGLYMIPTAEVALTNIHRGEVLESAELPLYYTAYTPCFRREAGSAGRDTRGLIRVHQFDKVEMVKFTTPEESYSELELMVADAENILQLLELPYRVIELCTGDIGFSAAKTYDLEVWLPSSGSYREISSCSNCGDFQARRASIKYRDSGGEASGGDALGAVSGSDAPGGSTGDAHGSQSDQAKGFKGTRLVHTLNGSGLAVGRTMAAILENYQRADGTVEVPEVLRPYMGGIEQIG